MRDRMVDIAMPEGAMNTFICQPEGPGPFPAVVIYMDFWGFREELFDLVRRVASVGYYCIMPNFYYRQGKKVSHAFYDDKGRMISFETLDEERQKIALEPLSNLSNAMVVRDTQSLLDFMFSGEPVRRGAIGSMGYCMGGRHVLCVSGHFPEFFRAGASLHGTNLILDQHDSPHHLADKFRGELYCGFAETDPYARPEIIRQLSAIMAKCPLVDYRYEIHKGADHGYALPDRDVFHKQGANRDWELILAMFRRQLPPVP
jgi:carboxymethylenebutenolidase